MQICDKYLEYMSKLPHLILLFISFTFISCDNDITTSQVPSIVENTFKTNFVHAKDVDWEMMNSNYEVSFEVENVSHDAFLDGSGDLLKYKYNIDGTALPNTIRALLKRRFANEKWDDAEIIIDRNSKYYQLELEGFFTDKKLVVDSSGNILSNSKYWN